jgi:hypothetical protein
LNTLVQQVLVTDDRRHGAEQLLADYARWPPDLVVNVPRDVEAVLEAPYCLIGTVSQIVEQLQERRERHGISYLTVHGAFTDALAPVVDKLAGS